MIKFIYTFLLSILLINVTFAQHETREELEKKRQELKKENEQIQQLLNANKNQTKEGFVHWKLIDDKVNIQDKVIDNINKDINLLDNNIYTLQKDVNRYDKLLDTLKQEYAKSMVYAYKNRGNYAFMNFIFSAGSFNDAFKRIAYLKSYRNYREMQGQNILRTQELRKKRIEELGGVKEKKGAVLEDKDKELTELENQKQEQNKILENLKKQTKTLNDQIAANRKRSAAVSAAISAAIERARKEAIAKAKAEREKRKLEEAARLKAEADKAKEAKRLEDIARAKAISDRKEAERIAKEKNIILPPEKVIKPTIVKPIKEKPVVKELENELLNKDNIALNTSFEKNRGQLPWPVDNGRVIYHFGANKLPSGGTLDKQGINIATNIGAPVKAIFNGVVENIYTIEDMQLIVIQHGKYFSNYANLNGVTVQKGQAVSRGQVIGKAMSNLEGVGSVEFYLYNDLKPVNPESWLRSR